MTEFSSVEVTIARPRNMELGCPVCEETEKLIEMVHEYILCLACGSWFDPEDMELVSV